MTQAWCYSQWPLAAWEQRWVLAGLPRSRHPPGDAVLHQVLQPATQTQAICTRPHLSNSRALLGVPAPTALPYGSGWPQRQWPVSSGVQRQSIENSRRNSLRSGENTQHRHGPEELSRFWVLSQRGDWTTPSGGFQDKTLVTTMSFSLPVKNMVK